MKKPLIISNWKLNGNKNIIDNFIKKLKLINNIKNMSLVIAPPIIYLEHFKNLIFDKNISLAAQNIDIHNFGAFTGEISVDMVKDIGAKYVIIGHSERRILHKEDNNIIFKKIDLVKKANLISIVCIGENEIEYKNNETKKTCINQINSLFYQNKIEDIKNIIIAYEPIWAIGTGKSADPEKIQYLIRYIKKYIKNKFNISEDILMLYGGSVNEKNAKNFLQQPDIDGLLVGNASLEANFFSSI